MPNGRGAGPSRPSDLTRDILGIYHYTRTCLNGESNMAPESSNIVTGGCLCGAVRYEAEGPPIGVGNCHCQTCRHHTGAPMVTFVMFEAENVRFPKAARSTFGSSPGVKRGFCPECGTPLTWEGRYQGLDIVEFHVGTTDAPDAFPPEFQWYANEKLAWMDLNDDLPDK